MFKATNVHNETIYLNPDHVRALDFCDNGFTIIYYPHNEESLVTEPIEEVVRRIKEAKK
jgi:uncharacterized protein YlzI (FlbEa/FlbD family)